MIWKLFALIFCVVLLGCPNPGSGRVVKITQITNGGQSGYTVSVVDSSNATLESFVLSDLPPVHVGDTIYWDQTYSTPYWDQTYGTPYGKRFHLKIVRILEEESSNELAPYCPNNTPMVENNNLSDNKKRHYIMNTKDKMLYLFSRCGLKRYGTGEDDKRGFGNWIPKDPDGCSESILFFDAEQKEPANYQMYRGYPHDTLHKFFVRINIPSIDYGLGKPALEISLENEEEAFKTLKSFTTRTPMNSYVLEKAMRDFINRKQGMLFTEKKYDKCRNCSGSGIEPKTNLACYEVECKACNGYGYSNYIITETYRVYRGDYEFAESLSRINYDN